MQNSLHEIPPLPEEACAAVSPQANAFLKPFLAADFFQEFFSRRTLPQFLRYIATGLISFAVEISLLYIFTEVAKLWYVYSNSIAYVVVYWVNFLLNRFWAFKSKSNFKRQMFMVALLFMFNLFAQDGMMYFLTHVCHIYYLISKVFAVGLVVTWNFILYKKVIYT
ncbi:MAG: GtrA family protein [Firmicutes bacterium]|nr:GtrA family protein [Bacillota bacterium]